MCITVSISLIAVVIFNIGISDVTRKQFENRSVDIARLVALGVDTQRLTNVKETIKDVYEHADNKVQSNQWGTPEFEEYVSRFSFVEDMEDFKQIRADLRKMQDVLDVDCIYLIWVDVENVCYIYLVDADEEEPCPPGCIDPVYLENTDNLNDHIKDGFSANITNTEEYGWLITSGTPIFNDQGEVIAFATVDISMNDVMAQQHRFLLYAVLAFLVVAVIVCLLGIWLVTHFIISPINKLSHAAEQYTHNRKTFSELNISRGDEIGVLADSMIRMETDISDYIESLEKTTDDLISAREHAEQLDIVANIDPLTQVRNKRAYDIKVAKLNENPQPYGIVMVDLNDLKGVNDTYGHEKGDVSIKSLCKTVCQTFKHSPVYRIGGDEFIVILENEDYENRESLLRSVTDAFRLNSDNADLQPWERATAAVGYAIYDPETDDSVDDVLKRADKAMYKQKKEMKKTK